MYKGVSATGKTVGEIQALACELFIKGPKHKIKKKQTNTQVKESINKLKERKGGTKGRRELPWTSYYTNLSLHSFMDK